ncbi:MAG: hypothetical protein OK456_07320, partial [Thaumarchaeota archaeon]|nr:hypothetical protein [Nitrososphaerota archaeon]
VPEGVPSPTMRGVPLDESLWGSSEELLRELRDLAQFRDEMNEYLQTLLDELTGAAEASVKLKLPMLFT